MWDSAGTNHDARIPRIPNPQSRIPGLWRGDCWAFGIMSHARQILGKYGEDLACRELERRGYAIIARRYRRRGGELDIIARDGQTVVFVEVKTRTDFDQWLKEKAAAL